MLRVSCWREDDESEEEMAARIVRSVEQNTIGGGLRVIEQFVLPPHAAESVSPVNFYDPTKVEVWPCHPDCMDPEGSAIMRDLIDKWRAGERTQDVEETISLFQENAAAALGKMLFGINSMLGIATN